MSINLAAGLVLCFALFGCFAGVRPEERPATNEPQFVSQGGQRVVREGEDVELFCEVHDLGEFVILWKFNRSHVLFAGNLRIHRDDRISRDDVKGSLVIRAFRPENAGEYSCQVSTNPPQEIVYNVVVVGPPHIRPFPSSPDLVLHVGQPVHLKCEAEADTIEWRKSKSSVTIGSGPELMISKTTRMDDDVYECSAVNAIGQTHHEFRVRLLHKPEVRADPDLIHAPVGHSVDVICAVDAEPAADIQWRRGLTRLTPSDDFRFRRVNASAVLTIRNVTNQLYDNYTCSANNSIGTNEAVVQVTGRPGRPQFTSAPLAGGLEEYSVEWRVRSQSPITAYDLRFRRLDSTQWTAVSVQPDASNADHVHIQRFVLRNLDKDGNYEVSVVAHNQFGSTKSNVFAFVTSSASQASVAMAAVLVTCFRVFLCK
ncbi:limbic system-associated membrane protein-like [Oppia nitens]|uniref:limbic system-associated membrane protein-like n=1 Tax=Oppia nitens TaxID=1686743 RepID=UPI0023DA7E7C|nr:limbic system-associated membrane protein-like [Oppia nitens]